MDDLEDLPSFQPMLNPKSRRNKRHLTKKKHTRMKNNFHSPSIMEIKVANLLDELGVDYISEKTFPDLVSVIFPDKLLPVDFYIRNLKAILEIDGAHHQKRITGDKSYSLDRRKLNDKTRDLFCIKRGIKLLRLNSKDFGNYREIIIEFINKIKNK